MESSLRRSLVALRRRPDRLLGGGFADFRVALTPDWSFSAAELPGCCLIAMMSGNGIVLGVTA